MDSKFCCSNDSVCDVLAVSSPVNASTPIGCQNDLGVYDVLSNVTDNVLDTKTCKVDWLELEYDDSHVSKCNTCNLTVDKREANRNIMAIHD